MVKGVILTAAAMGATLTTVMRIQRPLAGLANMLVPNLEIVPTMSPEKFCRDPEEVSSRCFSRYCFPFTNVTTCSDWDPIPSEAKHI